MASLLVVLVLAWTSAAAIPALFDPPSGREAIVGAAPPSVRAGVVMRQRLATARLDILTQPDGSPRIGVGDKLALDLFDDARFVATVTAVDAHGARGHTWSATLDGIDHGHVILALYDGALVGTVTMPGATFRIGYAADGTPVIEQVDASLLPPEAEPVVRPRPRSDQSTAPDVANDTGAQIDVMVVFTASARTSAGGTSAMLAEVNAAVAAANQAYANDGLVQRLRLVYAGEVALTESGDFGVDLDTLQTDAAIAALRDAYGADLVSLLTDHGPAAAFCGIGFLKGSTSTADAPYAFSVVERDCASGNLSFPHELGHNMGAHHDTYVTSPGSGLFPYSHGYVDLVNRVRTIMSYNDQCAASGFNCSRIPYFSSPDRTFNGRVIGDASAADNARTLAQTADSVANYRQAVSGPVVSFADVPLSSPFWSWIESLVDAGITTGCATNPPVYCPDAAVTRAQMAAFLLKGIAYPGVAAPPAAAGNVFADVSKLTPLATWIEAIYAAGLTTGCATNPLRYCPDLPVTRGQMAVFLLRARHGADYVPPAPAQQTFADVPLSDPFASWISQLAAEGITSGCATNPVRYCPGAAVTRAAMAVFLVRAFDLPH